MVVGKALKAQKFMFTACRDRKDKWKREKEEKTVGIKVYSVRPHFSFMVEQKTTTADKHTSVKQSLVFGWQQTNESSATYFLFLPSGLLNSPYSNTDSCAVQFVCFVKLTEKRLSTSDCLSG